MEANQNQYLTHEASTSDVDHETMSLLNQPDDNTVVVFFDGDTDDTTRMPLSVYDKLTESDEWDSAGFVEAKRQ